MSERIIHIPAQHDELQRKNAALEAANRELLTRVQAMDNINDGLLVTEAEPLSPPGPRILHVNPAFERMTGYTAAEVVGQTPRLLQGEKTDRRELNRIRAALARQETVHAELTNYRKDGTEFETELEIVPLPDETGKVIRFVALQRDVTARKRAEELGREEEVHSMPVREPDGSIVWHGAATDITERNSWSRP